MNVVDIKSSVDTLKGGAVKVEGGIGRTVVPDDTNDGTLCEITGSNVVDISSGISFDIPVSLHCSSHLSRHNYRKDLTYEVLDLSILSV